MKGLSVSRPVFIILIAGSLLLSACRSTDPLRHPKTSATLWVQNSAEYQALSLSVYNTAAGYLERALKDSYWTAHLPQKNKNIPSLLPAIILDVDETVLDNSAYQARMIKKNSSFDPEAWTRWVREEKAEAVPGAVAFLQRAAQKGVAIFYLTNREAAVEESTRRNLKKLGFPLAEKQDHILTKHERDGWTSQKIERRAYVAANYRIIMLFGDNLNDFIPATDITQEEREELVRKHSDMWGIKWFILPNPTYGSWESALYNLNDDLSTGEIKRLISTKLDTKQ